MNRIRAPWTPEQVATLQRFQDCGYFHPYTCPVHSRLSLLPTRDGWVCLACDYTQDWAHDFTLEIMENL